MSQGVETNTVSAEGGATAARIIDVMADAPLALPNENALLTGDYVRSGEDLRIEGLDGSVTILRDYFADGLTPDLVIGGAVLKGKTIEKIAREQRETADEADAAWGSVDVSDQSGDGWGTIENAVQAAEATPLFAQADTAAAAAGDLGAAILGTEGAIAQITEAYGIVQVIRADGTRETVSAGAPIFEDDVLLTETGGSVGVTFVDGMSFSLGESAKMVFDEFAYDPANHSGGGVLSVLQGAFSFISGEAAHTAEDALMIETPTMTIGVRGTKVVSQINPDGQTSRIAIMSEESGRIGKIMVKTDKGETILDKPNTMVEVTSRFEAPSDQLDMSSADVAEYFGTALSVLPAPTDIFKPEMIEAGYEAAAAAVAQAADATSGQNTDAAQTTQAFAPQPAVETSAPTPKPAPAAAQTQTVATATVSEEAAPAPQPQQEAETVSAADTLEADRETEEQQTAAAPTVTTAPNTAPTATSLPNAPANEDQSFSYNLSSVFSDADGDTLTFSATLADGSAIPAWMSIDPTTGVLSGTPDQASVGTLSVSIIATDPAGASAATPISLIIANVNDAPTVVSALVNTSTAEDAAFSLDTSTAFADTDVAHGDSLAYTATLADGSALPGWLTINGATGELSGTPANGQVGVISVKVTATDGSAQAVNSSFNLTVTNVNDAPVVSAALSNASTAEDAAFSLDASTAFSDIDAGDSFLFNATLSDGSALPGWLTINSSTGVLSGTPANGDVGAVAVKVIATDTGDVSTFSTFTLTVSNVNDAPTVVSALANTSTDEDTAFSLDTSAAFADVDIANGDSLTYTATLADGSALPGWLTINGATGELSGTPGDGDVGAVSIKVTATDGSAQAVNSTFSLTVDNVNDAPTVSSPITNQSHAEDSSFTLFTATAFSDVDAVLGDTLGYTATLADGSPLPSWLSFNTSTGQLDGSPTNGEVGTLSIKVSTTDVLGLGANTTFDLTITNVNDAPVLNNVATPTLSDVAQNATAPSGDTVAAIVANGSITDVDGAAVEAIAVTGVDTTNGAWQFSTDGGATFVAFGAVTDNNATLLDSTALVRFVPNAGYTGGASFAYRAWDQSGSHLNGDTGVDVSTNGGTTAFSTASEVATVAVQASASITQAARLDLGGAEIAANTETNDVQTSSSVAGLSNGGHVVVWQSKNQDGDGEGIYMQRFAADGSKTGAETQVHTTTSLDQTDPQVVSLAGGGFVVIWTHDSGGSGKEGVRGQLYNADGSANGGEITINTTSTHEQMEPAVTALSDGGFVVAWQSKDSSATQDDIFMQRFASDGSKSGGEVQINTTASQDQIGPSIALQADGTLITTWASKNQDGDGYGVYMQRTDVDGNKIGGEVQVNTYTTSDQDEPEVTALSGGGYVIAWTSNDQDGDKEGIYFQVFDASGNTIGSESRANTTTANEQRQPAIEALADGGFVVAWESKDNDGDKYGVYAQRFDATGNAIGGETILNSTTTEQQDGIDLSLRTDGSLVATWTDKSSGSEEIVTRVFDANSGPQLTEAGGTGARAIAAGASEAGTLVGTDVDGDTLVYSILNDGSKGTATVDANTGQWTYQANGGESGADTVSYQVSDGQGGVDTMVLTFAIS